MKKLITAGLAAAALLGAVGAAAAQPRPHGWGPGPHYFWHGRHFHHRRWWHHAWQYY